MKKLLGIVVLGLLLTGCATTESLISSGKFKKDMSKSEFNDAFMTSYPSDMPLYPDGGSEFFANSSNEIVWAPNKSQFYVFKNVSEPVTCGIFLCKIGNGTLESWHDSLADARDSIKIKTETKAESLSSSSESTTSSSSESTTKTTSTSSSNTKKNTAGGKQKMVNEIKKIPGVADAGWPQKESLWIFMSNPNAGHDFNRLGYTVCNGAVTNFGVQKGYSITFWNPYTNPAKEIGKYRCF
tara:strand:+ start:526 stop:1245 length:720 start_codon:yes stop_codon:yes gene_type:complete